MPLKDSITDQAVLDVSLSVLLSRHVHVIVFGAPEKTASRVGSRLAPFRRDLRGFCSTHNAVRDQTGNYSYCYFAVHITFGVNFDE